MPKILNAKTVHDYNAYVGHADQHPLVSVIDYAALPPIRHSRTRFSVYALFLRDDCLEDLTYGCSKYDYREGTLICVSPGQIGGVEDNGEVFRIEGWALLFSPELLHGTPLAARMKEFTFFAYQVNEALHMTAEERATLIALMKQIQEELCRHPDVHQRTILVAYIELI
ncbi:AraC family transcriptional regulator, partial [Bacteroides gallinaceum]|nr:AraC family transcriptional regulator [Bacteroides gallinaceum]